MEIDEESLGGSDEEGDATPFSPSSSPAKKIPRTSLEEIESDGEEMHESEWEKVEPPRQPIEIVQDMNGHDNGGDCMIYAMDFIEPRDEEFELNEQGIPKLKLKRKAGARCRLTLKRIWMYLGFPIYFQMGKAGLMPNVRSPSQEPTISSNG